jgi:hypothetical protein
LRPRRPEDIGGSSGGGVLYTSFHALARNAYPNGSLPRMMWRQRMGDDFKGDAKCRAEFQQVITQTFHLGLSHEAGTPNEPSALLPLSHYSPIRGLVIAKSRNSSQALYTHFDARGDCAWLGHGPSPGTRRADAPVHRRSISAGC